jgi:hypothetical protein
MYRKYLDYKESRIFDLVIDIHKLAEAQVATSTKLLELSIQDPKQ